VKIQVTRAFLIGVERQEVGSTLVVPDNFGRELIHSGKAQRAKEEPPEAPPGPMTTTSTPAVVRGAVKKEKQDAG
jgi:hypothetical protein